MSSLRASSSNLVWVAALVVSLMALCEAQLSPNYYDKTCPQVLPTVKKATGTAIAREHRMAASLLRLHFHDCFVQVQQLPLSLCRNVYTRRWMSLNAGKSVRVVTRPSC